MGESPRSGVGSGDPRSVGATPTPQPQPHPPSAQPPPEIPLDLVRLARTDTIADFWSTLAEAGVPPPPVPTELVPSVRRIHDWHWSTFDVDPLDLYVLRPFVQWAILNWDRQPAFLFGRYDSVASASVLTLFVARGPIAVLAQHPWGDASVDPVLGVAEVAATYEATRLLVDRIAKLEPPARTLLHIASMQDIYTMLDLPEGSGYFLPEPAEEILHAPHQYESMDALFAAALETLPPL